MLCSLSVLWAFVRIDGHCLMLTALWAWWLVSCCLSDEYCKFLFFKLKCQEASW